MNEHLLINFNSLLTTSDNKHLQRDSIANALIVNLALAKPEWRETKFVLLKNYSD